MVNLRNQTYIRIIDDRDETPTQHWERSSIRADEASQGSSDYSQGSPEASQGSSQGPPDYSGELDAIQRFCMDCQGIQTEDEDFMPVVNCKPQEQVGRKACPLYAYRLCLIPSRQNILAEEARLKGKTYTPSAEPDGPSPLQPQPADDQEEWEATVMAELGLLKEKG